MDCYESLDSESGHPELEEFTQSPRASHVALGAVDEVPGKPILDDCLSPLAPRQDLPVVNLSSSKHKLWEIETPQLGRDSSKDYPTCILSACGRTWFILRLPIWNLVSLLGRGTSVWLVQENEVDPMFYLKRKRKKLCLLSESAIYGAVEGDHPVLAKLHDAGEGLILGEDQCLSACDRGSPLQSNSGEKERDVILHLSILKLHGRPINKHTTEKELLLGIRAAISAHKFLCDKGIPHRDINPNNIMLSVNSPSGTESGTERFLLDLDCAYIKRDTLYVPPARMPDTDGSTATLT
ncbi:hypothetical protein BDN70DRAFT_992013 [Pholiota conissans]|uniref:Protein kinase domain-containing protein n=1 Tax=Pholiota conissans TaxID=109636 RepID=A0A9P5Z4F9_9AGAR|nr:hypothetical protein BDN70DRAFT_992013 [Pholiota conissans]